MMMWHASGTEGVESAIMNHPWCHLGWRPSKGDSGGRGSNPRETVINGWGQVSSGLKQAGGGTDGHQHRHKISSCYKQALVLGPLSPCICAVHSTTSLQIVLALLSCSLPLLCCRCRTRAPHILIPPLLMLSIHWHRVPVLAPLDRFGTGECERKDLALLGAG